MSDLKSNFYTFFSNQPPSLSLSSDDTDSINLSGIDLSGSDLYEATIECINLSKANLNRAYLGNSRMFGNNLTDTIMSDGSIHP